VRSSVRARADLDEEIFSLSDSTQCPLSVGTRRFSRIVAIVALVAAVLLAASVALWWW